MSDDALSQAKESLKNSEMPDFAKNVLSTLLEDHGVNWHIELYSCESRKGSGSGGVSINLFDMLDDKSKQEMSSAMQELIDVLDQHKAMNGSVEEDPYQGYRDFLEQLEYFEWENDFNDQEGFVLDILDIWKENRIDFYRTLKDLKISEAREIVYKEIEAKPLGGSEDVCRTCGVFFYDNLQRHRGAEAHYCSLACQTKAEFNCIQCSEAYLVGKCSNILKRIRLMGWCSENCKVTFMDEKSADSRYISSMRRKSQHFGTQFDESITRREVFKRANGICYLCKSQTSLDISSEYNPLLATVDHIVAWVNGGTHTWENVANCCLRCNIRKKDR